MYRPKWIQLQNNKPAIGWYLPSVNEWICLKHDQSIIDEYLATETNPQKATAVRAGNPCIYCKGNDDG